MRNDQLKQALLRVGFQVTEETRGRTVHEFDEVDDKPTWHTLTQAERDYYADMLKTNVSFRN
jgi:uncharacterized protein with HEPN domain